MIPMLNRLSTFASLLLLSLNTCPTRATSLLAPGNCHFLSPINISLILISHILPAFPPSEAFVPTDAKTDAGGVAVFEAIRCLKNGHPVHTSHVRAIYVALCRLHPGEFLKWSPVVLVMRFKRWIDGNLASYGLCEESFDIKAERTGQCLVCGHRSNDLENVHALPVSLKEAEPLLGVFGTTKWTCKCPNGCVGAAKGGKRSKRTFVVTKRYSVAAPLLFFKVSGLYDSDIPQRISKGNELYELSAVLVQRVDGLSLEPYNTFLVKKIYNTANFVGSDSSERCNIGEYLSISARRCSMPPVLIVYSKTKIRVLSQSGLMDDSEFEDSESEENLAYADFAAIDNVAHAMNSLINSPHNPLNLYPVANFLETLSPLLLSLVHALPSGISFEGAMGLSRSLSVTSTPLSRMLNDLRREKEVSSLDLSYLKHFFIQTVSKMSTGPVSWHSIYSDFLDQLPSDSPYIHSSSLELHKAFRCESMVCDKTQKYHPQAHSENILSLALPEDGRLAPPWPLATLIGDYQRDRRSRMCSGCHGKASEAIQVRGPPESVLVVHIDSSLRDKVSIPLGGLKVRDRSFQELKALVIADADLSCSACLHLGDGSWAYIHGSKAVKVDDISDRLSGASLLFYV